MSYILIIDNGECYSDHRHWPVATVKTEAEGRRAAELFSAWRADKPSDDEMDTFLWDDALADAWLAKHPCPIPLDREQVRDVLRSYSSYTLSSIEVPTWAEGRK
jgi:hypothetical protein